MLDDQIVSLKTLEKELNNRNEGQIRDIFRGVRISIRQISLLESYGVSPLYYQSQDVKFLNKLAFQIHQEIGLPTAHPVISCISTSYYYSFTPTRVIFVPLAEPDFLLHLSDIYHEIGHHVLASLENETRLKPIQLCYEKAIARITEYYSDLLTRRRRENPPKGVILAIEHAHNQWKDWIDEIFCDIFSLTVLGPAYAWSHLHLTAKMSRNIHEFALWGRQSHPSDEGRMRALVHGLRNLGFRSESESITDLWREQLSLFSAASPEYQYACPDPLMKDITHLFIEAIRTSTFIVASPELIASESQSGSIRRLLNQAWTEFWSSPLGFRSWEKEQLLKLREMLNVNE